jgi:hypothetical protein
MVAAGYEQITGRRKRLEKADGFSVTASLMFYAKGAGKVQVTAEQNKLSLQAEALRVKKRWSASLKTLRALIR